MIDHLKKLYWYFESIIYEIKTRYFLSPSKIKQHNLPNKLIVSLTSYPPRFPKLYLTIKCLLKQTVQADLIILWVANSDEHQLPESILTLVQENIFEVKTYHDIRSYKKIIPTLIHYPNSFIVTADDDIYYPVNWLESLITSWDGNFNNIVAHRVHEVTYQENGLPDRYNKWRFNATGNVSSFLSFAGGGGGVLYPPASLAENVLDEKIFMDICASADDVWLFWMSRLNGSTTTKTPGNFNIINWPGSQKEGLVHHNVCNNANDKQINKMIDEFGWPQDK